MTCRRSSRRSVPSGSELLHSALLGMVALGPPCLLWQDLKPEHIAQLDAASDEAATKAVLVSVLGLNDTENPLRQEVLLEMFVNLLGFTTSNGFSAEKTSTLFSLMKKTHDDMADAFLPANQTWDYFRSLLLAHSIQRPPYSVGVFTLKEVEKITAYALENYFRQFKLFRYAFTTRHLKDLSLRNSWIDCPPASLPQLSDGVPTTFLDELVPGPPAEAPPPPPPPPPPDFSGLNLPPDVLAAVQEQLAAQVAHARGEIESAYTDRLGFLEEKLNNLEGKEY